MSSARQWVEGKTVRWAQPVCAGGNRTVDHVGYWSPRCAAERLAYWNCDFRTVVSIQKDVVKQGKRNTASRLLRAKGDKETIAAWRKDLTRVLHIFNVRSDGCILHSLMARPQTELAISTHMIVADIHRRVLINQEVASGQRPSVSETYCIPTK